MGEIARVGDDAVAHAQRALGRLDQAMDVIEALRPVTPSRANSAMIISETTPWVGAPVLNTVPDGSVTRSGSASVAR